MPRANWDDYWRPDVFFDNAVTVTFGDGGYMKVSPAGAVRLSRRVVVDLECPMKFGRLPFDRQDCGLWAASYSMTNDELTMTGAVNEVRGRRGKCRRGLWLRSWVWFDGRRRRSPSHCARVLPGRLISCLAAARERR